MRNANEVTSNTTTAFSNGDGFKGISGVSKTSFIANAWKYAGTKAKDPQTKVLYKNEYMKLFVDDNIILEAQKIGAPIGVDTFAQLRHKHIKNLLSKALKSDRPPEQIIYLGSGLETLPIRKKKWTEKNKNLSFFELDQANVLDYKATIFKQNNIAPNSVFIKADYIKNDFISLFKEHGVDFNKRTIIVWEGNTYYLTAEQIADTLSKLKMSFNADLTIIFDYKKIMQLKTSASAAVGQEFNKMNAHITEGIANVEEFAKAMGFELIENNSSQDLYDKYIHQGEYTNAPPSSYLCSIRPK